MNNLWEFSISLKHTDYVLIIAKGYKWHLKKNYSKFLLKEIG